MDPRQKIAGERDDGPLGLAPQPAREAGGNAYRGVGQVEHLPLERTPAVVGDRHLAAARVVQAAGQVDQRQVGELAPSSAHHSRRSPRTDLADHRRGVQSPSEQGTVSTPSGERPRAVRVAEPGRQDRDIFSVRVDPDQSLVARGRLELAGRITLGGRRCSRGRTRRSRKHCSRTRKKSASPSLLRSWSRVIWSRPRT